MSKKHPKNNWFEAEVRGDFLEYKSWWKMVVMKYMATPLLATGYVISFPFILVILMFVDAVDGYRRKDCIKDFRYSMALLADFYKKKALKINGKEEK